MSDPIITLSVLYKILVIGSQMIGGSQSENISTTQFEKRVQTQVPASFAELGEAVLKCYHPTGRFKKIRVAQMPWSEGKNYRADKSMLVKIDWQGGFLRTPYQSYIGIVGRDNKIKTLVVRENTYIPSKKSCGMRNWVALNKSKVTPRVTNDNKIKKMPPPISTTRGNGNLESRLRKLKGLEKAGLISKEEAAQRRKEILNSL